MSDPREPNVLRTAVIVAALMLLLGYLAGCAPTPFVTGAVVPPPHGCSEARERGHDC